MSTALDPWPEETARIITGARERVLGAPGAATAIVNVAADGALTLACSCGADLTHPSGVARYTLQRLTSHMDLHASAAAQGVPWDVVQGHRQRLERTQTSLRDDDPGE